MAVSTRAWGSGSTMPVSAGSGTGLGMIGAALMLVGVSPPSCGSTGEPLMAMIDKFAPCPSRNTPIATPLRSRPSSRYTLTPTQAATQTAITKVIALHLRRGGRLARRGVVLRVL